MIVEIHEDAREDTTEAAEWYDRSESGLGNQFLAAVGDGLFEIGRLSSLPRYEALNDPRICRHMLDRFPYVIICEQLDADRVLVLAVAHVSRDTGFWKQRRTRR